MKALRYAAAILLGLTAAGSLGAQTTTTTATVVDSDGSVWINAPYTVNIVSLIPPVTNPGNQPFTYSFSGTTNGSGTLSVTLQRVANIFPANTTWKFCVTPAVATQTYCVNVPVGNAGQSSEDVSAQINAVIQPPRISGSILAQGYADVEFQNVGGNQYFNISTNTFRCYTTSWGNCGGTGTGIGSITWVVPSILTASPTTLSASGTQTFSLATQAANLFFAGPTSGGAVAPTFRTIGLTDLPPIAANTVLGALTATTPSGLAMPPCSGASNALIWTSGTGFGCNTISGGGGSLPTATAPGQIYASTAAGTTAAVQGQIFYSQSGDTIASIESECSSLCTYVVTTPQTFTLAANHTLSSNVQLDFRAGGLWTVNGAFTLTIPGNVTGTLNQHFAGTSTIAFGPLQQYANVEWFGAVGDGSTNDDTAIQNTLNALSAGQAVLQAKTYSVAGNTISITKSNVGILGTAASAANSSLYSTPAASTLLSSSTTADIIDAWGANAGSNIYGNRFQNFTLSRSVIPPGSGTGTGASGFSLKYSYGAIVDRVISQDSAQGFWFHGVGSGGVGYINNCAATWGFNGITETTGQYNGFWFDSGNGEASPSVRMTNNHAATNVTGAVTTIGLAFSGEAFNDYMGTLFESASTTYGIYINGLGTAIGNGAQDMHFINSILDQCKAGCVNIVNAKQSMGSTLDFDGGWMFSSSAATAFYVQGSNNVVMRGVQLRGAATDFIQAQTSNNIAIVGNNIAGSGIGIQLVGGTDYTANANLINTTGIGVQLTANAAATSIAGNAFSGMTTGVSIAAGSSNVTGLETNTFDAAVTTPISSSIPFSIPPIGSETVASSATPTFSNITLSSINTLTANVTSFTLAAGVDGQQKTLTFCQNATGGFTVAPPANVHGFMTVGTTLNKCSSQHYVYSAGQTAWIADSPGVINQ